VAPLAELVALAREEKLLRPQQAIDVDGMDVAVTSVMVSRCRFAPTLG
jgi:hypothetical protein